MRAQHLFGILLYLFIYFTTFFVNIEGISPDFPRQVITDYPDPNLNDIDTEPNLKRVSNSSGLPIDIISTTYVSDGRTLNGTIWLADPLNDKDHGRYVENSLTYYVFIYSGNSNITVPTYGIAIVPEEDGSWTKTLFEYEPLLPSREGENLTLKLIETTDNFTGVFENDSRYIDYSIDLGKISYPNTYWLRAAATATNSTTGMELVDKTFGERAPPTVNKLMYDWEKPIELRPGTERTIKFLINSTDIGFKMTNTFFDSNSSDGINISFSPNPVTVETTGINYTNMLIKVAGNANAGGTTKINHVIQISEESEGGGEHTANLLLAIDLLPALSIGDILVQSNLTFIIPVAITAGIIFFISKRIDKNMNYQSLSIEHLLTVDASVIAGVLIFFTISSVGIFSGTIQRVGILTASIVFPFSLAAIRTLLKGEVEPYGVKLTVAGFVYLMCSVIMIGFVNS